MDNYHLKEFSPDRKLFATIQNDGKLKIWDVEKNKLAQEYVPNLHLSTPCTALKWIKLSTAPKVRQTPEMQLNLRLTFEHFRKNPRHRRLEAHCILFWEQAKVDLPSSHSPQLK